MTSSVLGPFGAPFRKVSGALYLTSALLVILPALDFITGVYPYLPVSAKWRFASSAVFTGSLLLPILGLALAMMVAALMQQRAVFRLVSFLSLLLVLTLLAATGLLALDLIELRATAESEVRTAVVVAGGRALLKNLIMAGVLTYLAFACRAASGTMEPPRGETPLAPIVGAPRR